MSKRKCAVLEAVIAELRAAGLFYTVSRGGKHWKVAFIHNGRERLVVTGSSTSDWRATCNARAVTRRMLKAA